MSTVKQFGCVIATSLVALILAASGAVAADLGGNCCADLEERIAELEATTVRNGDKTKLQLQVTGVVNEAILAWDDGIFGPKNSLVGPNGVNPTRFAFVGRAQFSPGYIAGFTIAIGVGQWDALANGSMLGGQLATTNTSTYVRQAAVWVQSPFGKFTLGKDAQATYRVADVTTVDALHDADEMLSLAPFLGTPGLTEVVDFYSGQLQDIVKYETPTWNGFGAAASWGRDGEINNALACKPATSGVPCQKNNWDVEAHWLGDLGGKAFKGAARVGYRDGGTFNGLNPILPILPVSFADKVWSGGASLQHYATGAFVDVSAGRSNLGNLMGPKFGSAIITTWEVRVGDEANLVRIGKTVFYAEYADMKLDNVLLVAKNDASTDVKWWGLGVIQEINGASMNVYANVKQYMLGSDLKDGIGKGSCDGVVTGACAKDTTVGMIGAAVHF